MAGTSGGNNPIKYSDIFDTNDASVVKEVIDNIKAVDEEYNKLIDSIKQNSQVLKDSFSDAAKSVQEAMKNVNLSNEAGRQQILDLTKAVEELREKLKAYEEQQKNSGAGATYAADSVNGLKKRITELTTEYNKLSVSEEAEKKRMQEIVLEMQGLKKEQKNLVDALKLTRTQTDYVTGSYKALEEETKRLMKELKEMPNAFEKGNKAGEALVAQINANNERLKEYDRTLGIHNRNVGNYRDALGGVGNSLKEFGLAMAGAYLGFEGIQGFAEKVVQDNAEIADSLSDVRRAASLTEKEGDKLVETLKKIDTRTTLKGLTDLAVIGGQLGFETVQDLAGFTKAIDQLAVVLSGEIEGGAEETASALGKINGVFKTQAKEGTSVEQSFLKTGSAILKLGQAGLATGEYLTDFTQRVGASAMQADISLPTMLAYGSTLEEMGISAEIAGTAMTQLITKISAAPDAFFKVAKAADPNLTLKGFTDLINTDMTAALDKFFAGLNKAGGTLTGFNGILTKLGLDGSRVNGVITTLAKNQELLSTRVKQATDAYQDGTLASEQFAVKNNNLAAALEKAGNAISNAFVSSEFSQGIANMITAITDGKSAGDRLTESFQKQNEEMKRTDEQLVPLLKTYDDLKAKAEKVGGQNKLTKEEQAKLNTTIQAIAELLPGAITAVDAYGNAIDIARGKINNMTQAMRENIKAANQSAAASLREEIATRNNYIKANQNAIEKGTTRRDFPMNVRRATAAASGSAMLDIPQAKQEAKEAIAQEAGKNAEAIKKLRDVLMQDLSPAEQKVYEDFYGSINKTTEATKEQARVTTDNSAAVIESMGKQGGAAKRVKTEIEKLADTAERLKKTLESQAIAGNVSRETLEAFVVASEKLETAQNKAKEAVTLAIDPYQNLQNKADQLNQKLQRQIGLNQDTSKTVEQLTAINAQKLEMEDKINVAIANTVGMVETFNTELAINRRKLEDAVLAGEDYADILKTVGLLTGELEGANREMGLAILSVTDPMAYLSAQAEEYKRILAEQAAQGNVSAEAMEKYRAAIDALSAAQDKLRKATDYDPKDPAGKMRSADIKLEQNQQGQNGLKNSAENGDTGALSKLRELEAQKLAITLERLNAEQQAYEAHSLDWERIETQKTDVLAQEEKLRTDIMKEEWEKRAEYVMQGLELMATGVNGYFDIQKSRRDNDLADLQSAKEKELTIAGNNKAAQAKIEEKYRQKEAEVKRKQAQADKIAAIFQIAIQTAIAAAKAVASSPMTFGMPFLAFALAQGALQIALVAAKPIPKYAKGRRGGGAEWAYLGEQGSEAITNKRLGTVRMTASGEHMGYLNAGDEVHTAQSAETRYYSQLLAAAGKNGTGDAAARAYEQAAASIIGSRQAYDVHTTGKALQVMAKGFNIASMEKAFGDALDKRPTEKSVFDDKGFRKFTISNNQAIENVNQRNSMGGWG